MIKKHFWIKRHSKGHWSVNWRGCWSHVFGVGPITAIKAARKGYKDALTMVYFKY